MKMPIIIIVDDDEAVRDSLGALLDSLGFETFAYGTAEDFIENSNFEENVCVLLDYHLPGLTGVEILDFLSERQITVPVIIISGQADEDVKLQALNAGAIAVLDKPLRDELLLEMIKKASFTNGAKSNGGQDSDINSL